MKALHKPLSLIFFISIFFSVKLFSQSPSNSLETETQVLTAENPDSTGLLESETTDTEIPENTNTEDNNTAENTDTDSNMYTMYTMEENGEFFPLIAEYSDRPEVEDWRQYYLKSEKRIKLLHDILEYALEYRLYVRKTVQERQVPGELEYLPVVESGYKTAAKSKSGALGMWQFMENSVKPFLTLTEYVDERLDPWKSTEGGLSKLQDNYKIFNDWLLAIGAYNCGVGAMNKAIRRGESRDFWYLAENGFISSQTKDYVPKLIAIADLVLNADYYEIDLPYHEEEFENLPNERDAIFDYVTVSKAYSLSSLAREMRIDERQLKKLNPALKKGFTPPAHSYSIRVPVGMEDNCTQALANIEPIEFPFQYKVSSGDSLWSISRKFGTTVQAICDTNNIEENAILKIGKILYIPSK